MKHVIILPDLGQTTSEARIVSWLKNSGDKVAMGEPLLEVETDKATMYLEAYVGGYLRKKLAGEGEIVAATNPVAIVTDTPEESFEEEAEARPASVVPAAKPLSVTGTATVVSEPVAAVPAARALARRLGIDLKRISGSGPGGLITSADVERFASRRESPAEAVSAGRENGPLLAMAALTSSSKSSIPHFYVTVDLDVSAAEAWRSRWNETHPHLRASVNDCLVRAASAALAESPRLNVRVTNGKYEEHKAADVLLVAGADGGLSLVPLSDPHAGEFEPYLGRIKEALGAAKEGKVRQGAVRPVLAVSNLGMYGVKEFAAIIPPGCSSILAIGAIRDQLVLRRGEVETIKICSVTLSADHRVVDGIAVAQFLERMQFHLNSL